MSTIAANNITDSAGSGGPTLPNGMTVGTAPMPAVTGTAPIYACRAWVNFNGTGTVAIRASGNVSSVSKVATGRYTVNLSTAMPDANYTGIGMARRDSNPDAQFNTSIDGQSAVQTASAFSVCTGFGSNGAYADSSYVEIAIFR